MDTLEMVLTTLGTSVAALGIGCVFAFGLWKAMNRFGGKRLNAPQLAPKWKLENRKFAEAATAARMDLKRKIEKDAEERIHRSDYDPLKTVALLEAFEKALRYEALYED